MIDDLDGLNGTDNVTTLFPDKPSAAPLPPQPEIVGVLENFILDAASGKITGLIVLGFDGAADVRTSITGKVSFTDAVTSLEQMKFGILARDYARNLAASQSNK